MTWALASAEARATAHDSFRIPPRSERESLRVGNVAKLIFVSTDVGSPGERMWVEIVAANAGRYQGRLRNTPVLMRELTEDDPVEFGPEHVADWSEGEDA
jgi:uncharacterized protein YegJ (DUF2314 family)